MSTPPETPQPPNVVAFPTPTPADKKKSQELWSVAIMDRGYSMVPTLLMWGQAKLGLKADEFNVLLQLISHRWHADTDPRPAKETIATRMGRSPRTIQRYLTKLEDMGLITRVTRFKANKGQDTNGYNLDGLVKKLDALAPEFKKVADLNKRRRAKVETPAKEEPTPAAG